MMRQRADIHRYHQQQPMKLHVELQPILQAPHNKSHVLPKTHKSASLNMLLTFLFGVHVTAACVHLVNFIMGFLVLSGNSQTLQIHVERQTNLTIHSNTTLQLNGTNTTCTDCTSFEWDHGTVGLSRSCMFSWDSLQVLAWSELVTAAFHVYYIIENTAQPYTPWWVTNNHPARWVEYGVTATTYTLSNLVGIGAGRNVYALVLAGAVGVTLQLVGGLGEFGRGQVLALALTTGNGGDGQSNSQRQAWKTVVTVSLLLGLLLQFVLFGVIIAHTAYSGSSGYQDPEGREFEGFQLMTGAYVAQYLLFPVVYMLYQTGVVAFPVAEALYTVAGLTTKTSLFWLVFSTVRYLQEDFLEVVSSTGVSWVAVQWSAATVPVGCFLFLSIFVVLLGKT